MNGLSLFAGIGGLDLGLERAGIVTVGQVEADPFCLKVLEKHWPNVPRHDDVRTAAEWWTSERRPHVDIVQGGFPCTDISNAGPREGITGARSGLWAAMADCVRVLRPRWVLLENVGAIRNRGIDRVLGDLAALGYNVEWDCVPAAAVGAPHRRDRWFAVAWLGDAMGVGPGEGRPGRPVGAGPDGTVVGSEVLAHAHDRGCDGRAGWSSVRWGQSPDCGGEAAMADADRADLAPGGVFGAGGGPALRRGPAQPGRRGGASEAMAYAHVPRRDEGTGCRCAGPPPVGTGAGSAEPGLGRVFDGLPAWLDRPVGQPGWPAGLGEPQHEWEPPRTTTGRLPDSVARRRALGNAVVPAVAEHVGRLVVEADARRSA